MSQSTAAAARPVARPAARLAPRPAPRASTRPAARLRVVSPPAQSRSRAGLVVASLVLLALGLVGLLLLNVSLEKGAFVRRTQLAEIQQLTDQKQALQEELAALGAPQSLAARAEALGMVEAPNTAFVDATNGHIMGSPGVARKPATVTPSGPSAAGDGAATGSRASSAGAAAGKTTATAKVTGGGKPAATITAAPSGKPASSAARAKAPAPTATPRAGAVKSPAAATP